MKLATRYDLNANAAAASRLRAKARNFLREKPRRFTVFEKDERCMRMPHPHHVARLIVQLGEALDRPLVDAKPLSRPRDAPAVAPRVRAGA